MLKSIYLFPILYNKTYFQSITDKNNDGGDRTSVSV